MFPVIACGGGEIYADLTYKIKTSFSVTWLTHPKYKGWLEAV